jgi:hypothetical protein
VIVAVLDPLPERLPSHDPPSGRIQGGHLRHDTLDVPLMLEHVPQRGSDFPLGQDPGRALVQQRLEYVMFGAVDKRDLDGCPPKRTRREEPSETASHDHDPP